MKTQGLTEAEQMFLDSIKQAWETYIDSDGVKVDSENTHQIRLYLETALNHLSYNFRDRVFSLKVHK